MYTSEYLARWGDTGDRPQYDDEGGGSVFRGNIKFRKLYLRQIYLLVGRSKAMQSAFGLWGGWGYEKHSKLRFITTVLPPPEPWLMPSFDLPTSGR